MSVPYLKLEAGDGIGVVFKNQVFLPTPIPVQGLPMPVMVMRINPIEGVFVEWVRDSEGDPVGVVFTDLDGDLYCLPLATPQDHGGVYVKKLHDGALAELQKQHAEIQAAQAAARAAAQQKEQEQPSAVVLAHSVPGVDKSRLRR
jgi:hypothetical protein